MADGEPQKIDEEPHKQSFQTDEYVESSVNPDSIKQGGAFSKLKRELQEEDLSNRGTQILILNELDKYEACKKQLELYRDKFHATDKENAVLSARISSSTFFEITNSALLTIGSILVGLTPSVLKDGKPYYLTWIILSIGIVALVGSIATKFLNKK
ncbi:hypothetical protein QUW50_09105 [Barnesiella viscericola]|uniref:hypothetical protein n=1 Tax=Barnesiella viscericola TaxID=397865 RepID=UPI0025A36278|nr:hypothetical protein [Barnesiella viscericola]MDM8269189.1 hypothetical protein [Barnesiella viscericola]